MAGAETALIVEVPEVEALVGDWRAKHDPVAARGIPAHVTALFPFVPPGELSETVLDELRYLCSTVQPFDYELVEIDRFPEAISNQLPIACLAAAVSVFVSDGDGVWHRQHRFHLGAATDDCADAISERVPPLRSCHSRARSHARSHAVERCRYAVVRWVPMAFGFA